MIKIKHMRDSIEIKDNGEIDASYTDYFGNSYIYKLTKNSFEVIENDLSVAGGTMDYRKIYNSFKSAIKRIKQNKDIESIIRVFNSHTDEILKNEFHFTEKHLRRVNEK